MYLSMLQLLSNKILILYKNIKVIHIYKIIWLKTNKGNKMEAERMPRRL